MRHIASLAEMDFHIEVCLLIPLAKIDKGSRLTPSKDFPLPYFVERD